MGGTPIRREREDSKRNG